MNAKKSKQIRRTAKLIATGKPKSEVDKIIKRHKIIYKELTVNDKAK